MCYYGDEIIWKFKFYIYIIYYYILERCCGKIIFVKEILIFKIESIYFEYLKF